MGISSCSAIFFTEIGDHTKLGGRLRFIRVVKNFKSNLYVTSSEKQYVIWCDIHTNLDFLPTPPSFVWSPYIKKSCINIANLLY